MITEEKQRKIKRGKGTTTTQNSSIKNGSNLLKGKCAEGNLIMTVC
jgi:hypothetical protein